MSIFLFCLHLIFIYLPVPLCMPLLTNDLCCYSYLIISPSHSHATVVSLPHNVPLIPLEFSLQNAVFDTRSSSSSVVDVEDSLAEWRWLDNWQKLTWTTQPTKCTYCHIFALCKASIKDGFDPTHGRELTHATAYDYTPVYLYYLYLHLLSPVSSPFND